MRFAEHVELIWLEIRGLAEPGWKPSFKVSLPGVGKLLSTGHSCLGAT